MCQRRLWSDPLCPLEGIRCHSAARADNFATGTWTTMPIGTSSVGRCCIDPRDTSISGMRITDLKMQPASDQRVNLVALTPFQQ